MTQSLELVDKEIKIVVTMIIYMSRCYVAI